MPNGLVRAMLLDECVTSDTPAEASMVAIVGGDGATTTRGELRRMAMAVANGLQTSGLRPGDRVAVLGRRSAETIAALLGAAMAGVVYVPLDPNAEPSYWRSVIDDLHVRAVLAERPLPAGHAISIPVLPAAAPAGAPPADDTDGHPPASPGRTPGDDLFVLTTSGSTGRPKGVLHSHRSTMAAVQWIVQSLSIRPGDVVLGTAPVHFAYSIVDIYSALLARARLVLAPEPAVTFPGLLMEAIERNRVSVMCTVPTVLRTLLDVGAFSGGAAGSLRAITYAGEPFQAPALARVMRALPHVTFINLLGSTETQAILSHRFTVPPADDAELPLGTPASFADVRLLDDTGAGVPAGEIGEIAVVGSTVMKGYISAEGFVPAGEPYRTGDFARLADDGLHYYCGRRDQQVKVRGVRIVLPAVERALLACPGVKEAAAFVIGQNLVACVGADPIPSIADLAASCRERLPSLSQPHRYVTLASFPQLSTGKLDRVALRAIAAGEAATRDCEGRRLLDLKSSIINKQELQG